MIMRMMTIMRYITWQGARDNTVGLQLSDEVMRGVARYGGYGVPYL